MSDCSGTELSGRGAELGEHASSDDAVLGRSNVSSPLVWAAVRAEQPLRWTSEAPAGQEAEREAEQEDPGLAMIMVHLNSTIYNPYFSDPGSS